MAMAKEEATVVTGLMVEAKLEAAVFPVAPGLAYMAAAQAA